MKFRFYIIFIAFSNIYTAFSQEATTYTFTREKLLLPFKENNFEEFKATLLKIKKSEETKNKKYNEANIIVDYNGDSRYERGTILKQTSVKKLKKYAKTYLHSYSFNQKLNNCKLESKITLIPNLDQREILVNYTNIDEKSLKISIDTISYQDDLVYKKDYYFDYYSLHQTIDEKKDIKALKGHAALKVHAMTSFSSKQKKKSYKIKSQLPVYIIKSENVVRLLLPTAIKKQIITVQSKDFTGKVLTLKDIDTRKALSPKSLVFLKRFNKVVSKTYKSIEKNKLTTKEEAIQFLINKLPKKVTIDHYYIMDFHFYGEVDSYEIFLKNTSFEEVNQPITIYKK